MEAKTNKALRTRNFNLRAYLAGGGVTVALIAAAVLVFASLGAYVAFEGLPVGGEDDDAAQVAVDSPETTAVVAADRSRGAAEGSGDRGAEPGGSSPARGDDGPGDAAATQLGIPASPGSAAGGDSGVAPAEPAPQPVEPAPQPNPVEPTSGQDGSGSSVPQPVSQAETTIGDVADLPVDLPDAITAPLDGAVEGAGALDEGLGD